MCSKCAVSALLNTYGVLHDCLSTIWKSEQTPDDCWSSPRLVGLGLLGWRHQPSCLHLTAVAAGSAPSQGFLLKRWYGGSTACLKKGGNYVVFSSKWSHQSFRFFFWSVELRSTMKSFKMNISFCYIATAKCKYGQKRLQADLARASAWCVGTVSDKRCSLPLGFEAFVGCNSNASLGN